MCFTRLIKGAKALSTALLVLSWGPLASAAQVQQSAPGMPHELVPIAQCTCVTVFPSSAPSPLPTGLPTVATGLDESSVVTSASTPIAGTTAAGMPTGPGTTTAPAGGGVTGHASSGSTAAPSAPSTSLSGGAAAGLDADVAMALVGLVGFVVLDGVRA